MYKFRKMIYQLSLSFILAAGSFVSVSSQISAAAPSLNKTIIIEYNGSVAQTDKAQFLDSNGSVYVPLRMVSESLKSVVVWKEPVKQVSIYAPGHTVELKPGGLTAQLNGKTIKLTAPAKLHNGSVYVPLRFIAQSLGAKVDWTAKSKKVSIQDQAPYEIGRVPSDSATAFWVKKSTGELYQASAGPATLLGKLSDYKQHQNNYFSVAAERLHSGEYMVTVSDNYGEPHVYNLHYTAYIKNQKLLKQESVEYYQRDFANLTSYLNQPLLTNGKQLLFLNPDTGMVDKQYDLVKLGGYDELYTVEGVGDHYLLIRPNGKGLLTLVDPDTGKKKQLYELVGEEDLKFFSENDIPYHGDWLEVKSVHNGVIELEYDSYIDHKKHKLTVKISDWL